MDSGFAFSETGKFILSNLTQEKQRICTQGFENF